MKLTRYYVPASLLFSLILLLGAVGFIYQLKPTTVRMPAPPPVTGTTDRFYDQVQNGMSFGQVLGLGGQPTTCEFSGAPPPTDLKICYWPNNISISFKNNLVTDKRRSSP